MSHKIKNFITGVSALELTAEERAFISDHQPIGFILFKRNCDNPEQMKQLTASLNQLCHGYAPLIMIDQEGGRVSRLPEKYFEKTPSMAALTALKDAQHAYTDVYNNYLKIAKTLKSLGINVDCAPVADLHIEGAHSVIGDRSFGSDPESVAHLSEAVCSALANEGVQSIIKHIPGHGRSLCDSHFSLPRVSSLLETLEATDFKVFRSLSTQKMAMTAHIVYEALDSQRCATTSPTVIYYIRNEIGFKGIILTDDLSMEALAGSIKERADDSLKAGCDILLHCNGKMDEMMQVAEAAIAISDELMDKINHLDCFHP